MTAEPAKKSPGRPKGEQPENAARRRRQLVEAAIESIATHGLAATTLATVARTAGTSQGMAVFYFKTKEGLLVETLRHHYEEYDALWRSALAASVQTPVDRLARMVLIDLDPRICTRRNLALWNSFWGEALVRPRFAELCETHDAERYETLVELCAATMPYHASDIWTPQSFADALDSMTDGMWTRMHITPNSMDARAGRDAIIRFLVTVMPTERARLEGYLD